MPSRLRQRIGMVLAALAIGLAGIAHGARAGELLDPPVISSLNGVLDLLIVARAGAAPAFAPYSATAWVYDICRRPVAADACPDGGGAQDPYGGTRLQLEAGDELRIRLINRLPPNTTLTDPDDTGTAFLALNPVNILADGLLVSPRFPTVDDPTYGDTEFVMTLNPANGPLPPGSSIASDVRVGHTDYAIKIPLGHPPGLFWFHPQIHGLALEQVSAGMAGIITVGGTSDYPCAVSTCAGVTGKPRVRHIILRDAQVLADGTLLNAQDPDFCDPAPAVDDPRRRGACPGVNRLRPDGGTDYTGGRWIFTLNGQVEPSITAGPGGEIWRLTNASGATVYDLGVHLSSEDRDLAVQLLAVDGVAAATPPLLVSRIPLRPGSRVELWVTYRDAAGRLAPPPAGTRAVLETLSREAGPTGHASPSITLASVDLGGSSAQPSSPQFLTDARGGNAQGYLSRLSRNLEPANEQFRPEPDCRPLARGHRRRIFLDSLAGRGNPDVFGLGYEEVDAAGRTVRGTFRDIEPFSPNLASVCVTLGPGNTPAHERWELVNLGGEDQGFHIQGVKFTVAGAEPGKRSEPPSAALTQDTIALPRAGADCKTVEEWRAGVCAAVPIVVDMAFAVAGDFVYRSDDLGKEDSGMMARLRVRAAK